MSTHIVTNTNTSIVRRRAFRNTRMTLLYKIMNVSMTAPDIGVLWFHVFLITQPITSRHCPHSVPTVSLDHNHLHISRIVRSGLVCVDSCCFICHNDLTQCICYDISRIKSHLSPGLTTVISEPDSPCLVHHDHGASIAIRDTEFLPETEYY